MNYVKEIMAEKSLTTDALAKKVGVSQRTLDPYMSGKSKWKNARGQLLLAVADTLEIDPHVLVEEKDKAGFVQTTVLHSLLI